MKHWIAFASLVGVASCSPCLESLNVSNRGVQPADDVGEDVCVVSSRCGSIRKLSARYPDQITPGAAYYHDEKGLIATHTSDDSPSGRCSLRFRGRVVDCDFGEQHYSRGCVDPEDKVPSFQEFREDPGASAGPDAYLDRECFATATREVSGVTYDVIVTPVDQIYVFFGDELAAQGQSVRWSGPPELSMPCRTAPRTVSEGCGVVD
jgi:hypothetical protein